MKVSELRVEESKFNKSLFVLVVKTEEGKEFVVSGDHYNPTYLVPAENSIDLIGEFKTK